MLPEVWPLEPDLLIVAFGRNDELDTAFSPAEHGRGRTDAELMPGDRIVPPPPRSFRERVRETDVYRAIRQFEFSRLSAPRPNDKPPKADDALRRVPLPQYVDNLRTIVAAARERKVGVILLSVGCFFEEYRKALLDVAREENVRAVNAFPLLFSKVEAIKTEPQYAPCRERLEQWLGRATMDKSQGGWLWFSTDFGHPNGCGHTVIAETLATLISGQ
jgi:hypothetical protein